jgi:hypothetical protein
MARRIHQQLDVEPLLVIQPVVQREFVKLTSHSKAHTQVEG